MTPGPSDVRVLTLAAAVYVANDLRPESRRDVQAMAGEITAAELAINRFQAPGLAWSFHDAQGLPYACAGLESERPGIAAWWLMTTAATQKHGLTLARFGRNAVRNLFAAGELHRIHAFVLADWPGACRLAESIGLRREATMRACGIRREDIAIFAATHGCDN
jgi:RimJ/RimL family protein N-acetyltransferase